MHVYPQLYALIFFLLFLSKRVTSRLIKCTLYIHYNFINTAQAKARGSCLVRYIRWNCANMHRYVCSVCGCGVWAFTMSVYFAHYRIRARMPLYVTSALLQFRWIRKWFALQGHGFVPISNTSFYLCLLLSVFFFNYTCWDWVVFSLFGWNFS